MASTPDQQQETASGRIAKAKKLPNGLASVIRTFSSLRSSAKYSDLVIKCGDHKWHAHQFILCPQSEYFTRACEGGFKEATEGIVDLSGFHPFVIEAVLDYLYNTDYRDKGAPADLHPLLYNVKIFALADYLQIPHLEDLAEDKFHRRVNNDWSSMGLAQSIRELYTNAPEKSRDMREHAVDIAIQKQLYLLESSEDWGIEFRKVLAEVDDFGITFNLACLDVGPRQRSHWVADATIFCEAYKLQFLRPAGQKVCPHCGERMDQGHRRVRMKDVAPEERGS